MKFKRTNHSGFIYKSNKIYLCFSAATHSNELIIDFYYGNENENAILLASTSINKCINKFFNDDDLQKIVDNYSLDTLIASNDFINNNDSLYYRNYCKELVKLTNKYRIML